MLPPLSIIVIDAICFVMCAMAALIDLKTRRIPNRLTLGGICLGLLLNFSVFVFSQGLWSGIRDGLAPSVAGCLLLGCIFVVLGAAKVVGMGDVKLMAAVGAFLGWRLGVWTLVYVLLAGGILAICWAIFSGHLASVLQNLVNLRRRDPKKLHKMPYGLAIFLGSTAAILTKHFGLLTWFG